MYTVSLVKFRLIALIAAALLCGCGPSTGFGATATSQTVPSTAPAASSLPLSGSATVTFTPFAALPTVIPPVTETPTPTFTPTIETPVVFAVIGDYGTGNQREGGVADLVKGWNPDFVITTGDNNYPSGSAETIDATVGQYYHKFISPYKGEFGKGADQNRFFPSLGNHDWMAPGAMPYLKYFTLPGNERYYDFTWWPLHFFVLDSDPNEPDGVNQSSRQAEWLQAGLAKSTYPWNIVYFHVPPYSSGTHGSTKWMRWPFKDWGATAVLAGHDHDYERLLIDGLPYFVNGLGGGAIYQFENPLDGSQVRYNDNLGAMRVEATSSKITFQFFSRAGELIDTYEIER